MLGKGQKRDKELFTLFLDGTRYSFSELVNYAKTNFTILKGADKGKPLSEADANKEIQRFLTKNKKKLKQDEQKRYYTLLSEGQPHLTFKEMQHIAILEAYEKYYSNAFGRRDGPFHAYVESLKRQSGQSD